MAPPCQITAILFFKQGCSIITVPAHQSVPEVAWWEWAMEKFTEDDSVSNENLRSLGSDATLEKLKPVALDQLKQFCSDCCFPTEDWPNLE